MRARSVWLVTLLGGIASVGCAPQAPAGESQSPPAAPIQAPAVTPDQLARFERLEARLAETEARLVQAEQRAATAEARVREALSQRVDAPAEAPVVAVPDRTVETRTEEEIKAAAIGVDDGAGGPAPAVIPMPDE